MLPVRTILHPTDLSENSAYAFELACTLARDYGAHLIVLHIMERPAAEYSGVMTAPPPPGLSAEERRIAREKLAEVTPPDATIPIEHLLVEGDPAALILKVAEERHCDLIAMGTHGRRGLTRLLMGSVAEQVLRSAVCPVLTVKNPHGSVASTELVEAAVAK
jgi:nucleotide-binding universal stress UspA family protein